MRPEEAVMERVEGIEPSSPAWKAGVIAFIRYPQGLVLSGFRQNLSFSFLSFSCVVQAFYRFKRSEKARSIPPPK